MKLVGGTPRVGKWQDLCLILLASSSFGLFIGIWFISLPALMEMRRSLGFALPIYSAWIISMGLCVWAYRRFWYWIIVDPLPTGLGEHGRSPSSQAGAVERRQWLARSFLFGLAMIGLSVAQFAITLLWFIPVVEFLSDHIRPQRPFVPLMLALSLGLWEALTQAQGAKWLSTLPCRFGLTQPRQGSKIDEPIADNLWDRDLDSEFASGSRVVS